MFCSWRCVRAVLLGVELSKYIDLALDEEAVEHERLFVAFQLLHVLGGNVPLVVDASFDRLIDSSFAFR